MKHREQLEQFRQFSAEELQKRLHELQKDLQNFQFDNHLHKLKDTSVLKTTKHQIAALLTIQTEQNLSEQMKETNA